MRSFISVSAVICILISSCASIKQSDCEVLKKEKVILGAAIEEMLDTTKGIYRLKNCGLDMEDIEMLRPFIANRIINGVKENKEYTYGDILSFYNKIKGSKEYKELKVRFSNSGEFVSTGVEILPDYSKLCDTPFYMERFPALKGYQQYFDYEQALKCAKEQKKILLIIFGGHSCVTNRKLELTILSDETIMKKINDNCIMASLYCDDKEIGKDGKEIGRKNLEFEKAKFDNVSQPLVVFLDINEKVLGKTGYGTREDFLKKLNAAIAANKLN